LYSYQDPLNAPISLEETFEFFLNPKSKTQEKVLSIMQRIPTWSEDRFTEEERVWNKTQPMGLLKGDIL
jgi:hypothetical protein